MRIICALFLLLMSINSLANDFRVVTEELSPYQIVRDDGTLTGVSTEIMKSLFRLTGDKFEVEVLPWIRAYKIAKKVPNVLIFSLSRTKFREDSFIWGGCIIKENIYAWGIKGHIKKKIETIEDIRPYKIALSPDSNPEQYFTQLKFKHIYRLNSQSSNVKMLYQKHVDVMFSSTEDILRNAKKHNFDSQKLVKLMNVKELNSELYFAFSLGTDVEIVERYIMAFNELKLAQQSFCQSV